MLLPIIHDKRDCSPPRVACCIGYDLKKWRVKKLSKFVLDGIAEFVLTQEEIDGLEALSPYSTLEKAIPFFTDPENPSSGGEVGELLAHSILRRDFGTEQLVKRLHYKMRSRDAVTGFDIVHVKVDSVKEIELWLGESKFIADRSDAISKAIKSLGDHLEAGVLTERKSLIAPKIRRNHPHYDQLQWLFHTDTKLEEIVSRMLVPVFIGSDTFSESSGSEPDRYSDQVLRELENISDRIGKRYNASLRLVFIYLPLNDKRSFDTDLRQRLKAFV